MRSSATSASAVAPAVLSPQIAYFQKAFFEGGGTDVCVVSDDHLTTAHFSEIADALQSESAPALGSDVWTPRYKVGGGKNGKPICF